MWALGPSGADAELRGRGEQGRGGGRCCQRVFRLPAHPDTSRTLFQLEKRLRENMLEAEVKISNVKDLG